MGQRTYPAWHLKIGDWPTWQGAVLGLAIGLVLTLIMFFWINTPGAKADRLAGMREACAAGRAEPLNCIDEGVPMTWAVKGQN